MSEKKWEEVSGGTKCDRWWNGKDSLPVKGDSIEGIYFEKSEKREGSSAVHILENEAKLKIGIWGSTVLDRKLEKISFGTEVKIVYLGKKASEIRRGKEYHDYQVFRGVSPTLD